MPAPPPDALSPSARPLRVLYADDVQELRDVTRMILTLLGHTLEGFENGQLAWDRVRRAPDDFDLILTDHHMPIMTGLEFVRLLRTLPFRGKIMVFSSDVQPGTALLYQQLKVDRFLNKPVPPRIFRQALVELFPSDGSSA